MKKIGIFWHIKRLCIVFVSFLVVYINAVWIFGFWCVRVFVCFFSNLQKICLFWNMKRRLIVLVGFRVVHQRGMIIFFGMCACVCEFIQPSTESRALLTYEKALHSLYGRPCSLHQRGTIFFFNCVRAFVCLFHHQQKIGLFWHMKKIGLFWHIRRLFIVFVSFLVVCINAVWIFNFWCVCVFVCLFNHQQKIGLFWHIKRLFWHIKRLSIVFVRELQEVLVVCINAVWFCLQCVRLFAVCACVCEFIQSSTENRALLTYERALYYLC